MESSSHRSPAVDVGPHTNSSPVVAFVLALLAVPGSTVAWSLPAGGLWIGLPLGIAAIVIGRRARQEGQRTGLATAAIVIAGLAIAQMAIWTLVSALS